MLTSSLKHAARVLVAGRMSSAAAVVSVAVGVGATTAMFSVADAVVLKPLPYPEAERLVNVRETFPRGREGNAAPANMLDWRREARSFDGISGLLSRGMALVDGGPPEQVSVVSASPGFFAMLGVNAALGRTFLPGDDGPGQGERLVVLSHALWQRRFGGDRLVIGRTVTLGARLATIVGVMPPGFSWSEPADLWLGGRLGLPEGGHPVETLAQMRDAHFMPVIARLEPGVTIERAQAEMDAIASRLARAYPGTNANVGVRLVPLHEAVVGDAGRTVWLLLGGVAFLLLIASVNIANLLLVGVTGRARELALRQALGASRGRLARQLLLESLLIALAGGLAGVAAAAWGIDALRAVMPAGLPRADTVALDGRAMAFALAITAGTGIFFGLWPAIRASEAGIAAPLHGARSSAGRRQRSVHYLLVGTELAVAQVLLAGSGLLAASFMRLSAVDPGFDPRGVLTAELSLPPERYASPERKAQFIDSVLERLEAAPGVVSVATALTLPVSTGINRGIWLEGRPQPASMFDQTTDFYTISPRYFETIRAPLKRGRAFSTADRAGTQTVAIVNEAFARRYFPGEDPIGRRIGFGDPVAPGYWRTIVGLATDIRQEALSRPAEPQVFIPFGQDREPWNFLGIVVRTHDDAMRLADTLRAAVSSADPAQPIARLRTLQDGISASIATRTFTLMLAAAFAGVAVLLALVGTFGVMSHVVERRVREFGIRLALGALPRDVVRLVLSHTARLAAVAIVVGLAGGWLVGRAMQGLLFGVTPADPVTLGTSAVVLGGAALWASYVPVRRALGRDPVASLRTE